MAKKFLSWLGLLALLGVCGGTATGLAVLRDRVRLVVQDDSVDPRDQQVAQLRDELAQVQRDVRALADGLSKGLEQLADEQAADAAARQAEVTARVDRAGETVRTISRDLATAVAEQRGAARAVVELEQVVRGALERAGALAGPPAAPSEAPALAVAPAAETAPALPPAAGDAAPSTEAAPLVATPAPAPRRRSAFAFELPSQHFRFDGEQTFELLPSLSRVGFDAKSTLHDFTGVTSRLAGKVRMNLAAPAAGCSGEIRVDARSLDTGLAGRNAAMLEHLATEQHPDVVFTFTSMTDPVVDASAQTVCGTVHGRMTIRGKTRDVAMPVQLSVDGSKRVLARGEMALQLSDYDVPVPSQLGMIKMQDAVKVWIALQARALGGSAGKDR